MKNQTLADLLAKRDQSSNELQDEFNEVFAKDKALEKCLTDAEEFKNGFYFIDDCSSLCYGVDLDTDQDYSDCIDELRGYILDGSSLYLNLEYGRAIVANSCGEEFYVIQSEGLGPVFCYSSDEEIARLDTDNPDWNQFYSEISADMEKWGHYPEVMLIDDHGGVQLDQGFYDWLKKKNEDRI